MLVRRLRDASGAKQLLHVGTSATMAGGETWAEQQAQVAAVATHVFGSPVRPERVIGERLRRATAEVDLATPSAVEAIRAVAGRRFRRTLRRSPRTRWPAGWSRASASGGKP
jgi:hypothetical protein